MLKDSLDPVAASIYLLPDQIRDTLRQSKGFKLPANYKKLTKVVVSGMGGSNLAARIFASLFETDLKAPLIINADYEIPTWIDNKTLFIASSYSGNTEETIAAYKAARKQKALLVALTADTKNNTLLKLARTDKVPVFSFTTHANPSDQPRLALGYSIFSLASILMAASQIKITTIATQLALTQLSKSGEKLTPDQSNNTAAKIAKDLSGCEIITITGPFLAGNAHAFRNQLNENSKHRASYLTLPEMNHYALEGLAHPENNKKNIALLFIESSLYSPRLQKRLNLTKQVATKNGVKVLSHKLTGRTKLDQGLELLQLGAWITYYLAQSNQVDPIKIPWVDWFKKMLQKN